ncbi:MAG: EAL domain-containing protein [Pseudomonadota bacterium]
MSAPAKANAVLDARAIEIAVNLQNLGDRPIGRVLPSCLRALRELCHVDGVFVAGLKGRDPRIASVYGARGAAASLDLNALRGLSIDELPGLTDTMAPLASYSLPDASNAAEPLHKDSEVWRRFGIGAVSLVSVYVNGAPGALLGLVSMKPVATPLEPCTGFLRLLGASLASGLERVHTRETFEHERERNELALFSANDGLWDFDTDTNEVYFSPRWKRMLGYDEDTPQSDLPEWRSLVHPDDLARVQAHLREHLEGRSELFESQHRMRHRNGDWRWMLSRAKARPDKNGRLRRLVGVELDITERRLYEEALFREKESAQITLQSIGDGVITTDADCLVEYLNPVAEELTGWKLADAGGRPVDDIFRGFHEETCEPLENALAVAIRRKRSIKSIRPTLLVRRGGDELYIESTASPIRDGRGAIAGGVLVFHDVSESRELNRRLSYHASHDILTGLVNRREFEERLEEALQQARSGSQSYAVCHMDLDQFKMVNDSCGHTAGDALLGQLGTLLKSKIRWRDTLARLGGDEFALLMESCTVEEAVEMAETLRKAIADYKFEWDERVFRLGVSVGVVPVTAESDELTGVMSAADSACAAAKEAGRNRIHCFHENDIEYMRRKRDMQWAARVNSGLDDDNFELFRQPIQPLNGETEGDHYELLLRMRDASGGLISPDVFIPACERYNIMPKIDRWVINRAFKWLGRRPDELARLSLCSINLSGQSLCDDQFMPFVLERLRHYDIDASRICFEITETAAIASYDQANRFINSLRDIGCRFALDDFGTGMSSFGYLKNFPVDFLKIDGSFVKGILHDAVDRQMVRSINQIGHITNKKTIAEFADSPEVIEKLKELGVDYAQGYGVAEPRRLTPARSATH